MFKEIVTDVRGFVREHRFVIYTVSVVFLIDHFFLHGMFRYRLKAIIEKIVGRVEKQITDVVEK